MNSSRWIFLLEFRGYTLITFFFYHVIYMSNIANFVRKERMEMTYC